MHPLRRHCLSRSARHVLLALLVLFAGMQVAGLTHLAEHDFASHEHSGQACDVLHYVKHGADTLPVEVSAAGPERSQRPLFIPIPATGERRFQHHPAQPRAPPLSLFV
ncbi:MAG TPA: hypothetical protein VK971_11060 [Thiohalobacter sp.]|nr:hypothetical protein [Thiohalobacter sp.]